MALSVANILLQVTGESDDARRELEEVAAELALFASETAEAEAELDTTSAHAALDELKATLAKFSGEDATADANVTIAKAQADIAALDASLAAIDRKEVVVDIDVRRGIVERIAALNGQIGRLGDGLSDVGSEAPVLAGGLGSLTVGFTRLGAAVLPVVVILGTALVAALAALIASLTEAVGGLGALAIAFGAALIPGIALGIGAILRFKETADTAGTAAHALKEAFGGFGDAFKDATAAASDAVFRGLADALRDLTPLVDALKPAFTTLGRAGGDAFRMLGEQFSSPAWRQFFVSMTESLAKLTPLFARSFGAFARILANIAQAAMPFLIAGMRDLAEALEGIARKTSNIGKLRESIGGMIDHLGTWLELIRNVGDAFLAFVEVAAPAGQKIAEWISHAAEGFAEWARSEDGRARIQSFFEDVLPMVEQFLTLLGKVAVIVLQITQFFAPFLTLVLEGLNKIADVLIKVIDWMTKLNRAVTLDAVKNALASLPNLIADVVSKLKEPIEFILKIPVGPIAAARNLWNLVKKVITDVIPFVLNFARDVPRRARDVWNTVRGVIRDAINFVINFARDIVSRARSIWGSVKGVITDGIQFVLQFAQDVAAKARDIWSAVKGVISDAINFVIDLPVISDLVSVAKDIWNAINDALPDITIGVHVDKPDLPGPLATGVRDLKESGMHLVGEEGPELTFLGAGTDVFTAGETRRILRALADGASLPAARPVAVAAALTGAGAGRGDVHVSLTTPAAALPDPRIFSAQLEAELRARGA